MPKRFLLLVVLVLAFGFVTRAFAENLANDAPISRAGAVGLIVEADPALKQRLQHFIKHKPPMPLFTDVDYNEWYAPYIETAFEAGIVTGNDSKTFRPGDVLAEEEAIVLAARYNAIKRPDTVGELNRAGSDWFTGAVNAAVLGGITLPSPIHLGSPVTRTSLFTMLQSAGVSNPAQVTISYVPKPAPVIIRPVQQIAQRPVQQVAQRQAQQVQRPVQQQVARPVVAAAPRPVQQQQPVVQRPTYVAQAVPQPTRTTTPTPAPVSNKAFAISLPTLGISDLTITHPANPSTSDGLLAPLKYGVGHLFSYPGAGGTILVYGHSSSYGWDVSNYTKIFRRINQLSVGDKIYVTYGGKQHTYQVTFKQSVPANDLSAYKGGRGEELILYTCWPPDSIKERYLVHASPISEVAAR